MQAAVAELPRGLDQRGPGVLVADAVGLQATRLLEATQGVFRGVAEDARLGARGGGEPGGSEAALQIANGLAALTGSQREVGRNSFNSWSS